MGFPFDPRPRSTKEADPPPQRLDASEPLNVHSWSDGETHIRVTNPEGFSVKVEAHARIDLPCAEVYSILTAPDNHEVFTSIVAIPYRKVVRKNLFAGQQTVEVDHEGRWRLGPLRGKIVTRLLVDEDSRAKTVRFSLRGGGGAEGKEDEETEGAGGEHHHRRRLASGSFMSRFEGGWRVSPMSQGALDRALGTRRSPFERAMRSLPFLSPESEGDELSSTSSLVSLEHALSPSFAPPPPFDRVIVSIAARQVRTLLEDLREEAARRRRGDGESRPSTSTSTDGATTRRRPPPPFPPLLW